MRVGQTSILALLAGVFAVVLVLVLTSLNSQSDGLAHAPVQDVESLGEAREYSDDSEGVAETEDSSLKSGQGYPPPVTDTPTPTSTPLPGNGGYLPGPGSISFTTETITSSQFAGLLTTIEDAFSQQDSSALEAMVTERFGNEFGWHHHYGTEAGVLLDAIESGQVLATYFGASASPRVQGYLMSSDPAPNRCVIVFLHAMPVPVNHPTPHPTPTSVTEPMIGAPSQATIQDDAAAWKICEEWPGNTWMWTGWTFGEFYPMVEERHFVLSSEGWQLYMMVP